MGCDIHLYIEYSEDGGKSWTADPGHVTRTIMGLYTDIEEASCAHRNYRLFAKLSNVRGSGPTPRGLPKNLSETIKQASQLWKNDCHSHSYITPKQFEKRLCTLNYTEADFKSAVPTAFGGFGYPNIVAHYRKIVNEKKAELEFLGGDPNKVKCRIVFWFDS